MWGVRGMCVCVWSVRVVCVCLGCVCVSGVCVFLNRNEPVCDSVGMWSVFYCNDIDWCVYCVCMCVCGFYVWERSKLN